MSTFAALSVAEPAPVVLAGLEISINQTESSKEDAKYSIDIVFHGRVWSLKRTYTNLKAFHATTYALDRSLGPFPASHKHTTVAFLEDYI